MIGMQDADGVALAAIQGLNANRSRALRERADALPLARGLLDPALWSAGTTQFGWRSRPDGACVWSP